MTNLTKETFDSHINQDGLNLVLFGADWCTPCQRLKPIVEQLADKYKDVANSGFVDVDAQPGLTEHYSVRGIPALLFFKAGKIVESHVGAATDLAKLSEKTEEALGVKE
jgi:thioredoxin 1